MTIEQQAREAAEELSYKALDAGMEVLRDYQSREPDLTQSEQSYICDAAAQAWRAAAEPREKEIAELREELASMAVQNKDLVLMIRGWAQGHDHDQREITTLRARVAELEKVASLADSIAHEFEVAVESRNPVGGMSVPPSGDFISCAQLPSAVGRMRWWAREIRKAQQIPASETNNNASQQGV